jgi:hypothetical protein
VKSHRESPLRIAIAKSAEFASRTNTTFSPSPSGNVASLGLAIRGDASNFLLKFSAPKSLKFPDFAGATGRGGGRGQGQGQGKIALNFSLDFDAVIK